MPCLIWSWRSRSTSTLNLRCLLVQWEWPIRNGRSEGFCFWQSTKSADKEELDILFNTFLILFAFLFCFANFAVQDFRASMLLFSWLSLEQKFGPAMFRAQKRQLTFVNARSKWREKEVVCFITWQTWPLLIRILTAECDFPSRMFGRLW